MIRVALIQADFCVGDIDGNAKKIISFIHAAKKSKADLVVFPELALTGYPPQDLLLKKHFIRKNICALESIRRSCRGIAALVGCVESSKSGALYDACAFIQDAKIVDVYRKVNLANYGVFDEKRYFSPGKNIPSYSLRGYRFTVNICEDIWRKSFVHSLAASQFDFIVNLAASPFHVGKFSQRRKTLSFAARQAKSTVYYCNLVGGQDELIFDGTSMAVSPKGEIVSVAKRFKEELLLFPFPLRGKPRKIKESVPDDVVDAICLGIKDYVRKNNFKKVVVGVSGGLDSAVVASLATMALGAKNVIGIIMPSCYTSKETFRDARALCRNLNISHLIVGIDDVFFTYRKMLISFLKKSLKGTAEENIQARIRGNILMAFSNAYGYLVLNTGNKSEMACGYCTLYGDMVGGFGVLSDVPKTLVYRLARVINARAAKNIIPLSVLRRPPTAELKPNQKDTDSLPPYTVLDPILQMYIEEDLSRDDIVRRGVEKNLARKVIEKIDRNEYKRRQAPLGIKITPKAFGKDRHMPVTNCFRQ